MSIADYTWVHGSGLEEAGCVTVVPGGDVAEVLAAYGAVPASARAAASFDDVDDMHAGLEEPICVIELPDAVVVFENNGFQGSRVEVLGPASRASSAFMASSFFWNVNAVTAFSAARRGKLVFSVELIGAEDDEMVGIPKPLRRHVVAAGQLPPDGDDDESGDYDMLAAGLDLVRRWTSVDFGQAAVTAGTVYDTDPPPSGLVTHVPQHSHILDMHDAPRVLAAMDPTQQRAAAAWGTGAALREAGLSHEPAVARALEQLATDGSCEQTPTIDGLARAASSRHELFLRLLRLQEVGEDLPPHSFTHAVVDDGWGEDEIIVSEVERLYLGQESNAYRALQYLAHPDAYSAAVACVGAASLVFLSGRSDRGWSFTENQHGRRYTGTTENPRHEAFIETADRFLLELPNDPAEAARRATEELPPPFTEVEKDAAIHADLAAAVRGEFREWQQA